MLVVLSHVPQLSRLKPGEPQLLEMLRDNWQPRPPWGAPCEAQRTHRLGAHLLLGRPDGNKLMCDVNQTLRASEAASCKVVSVGSNGDSTFESQIRSLAPHCSIDTWDGTLTGRRAALKRRLPTWLNLIERNFDPQTWSHYAPTTTTVRLLKIDCEGCEFDSLPNWLDNICTEQILIEVHGCECGHCVPSLNRNVTLRSLRLHALMERLTSEFSVFALERNPFSDLCVEYSLRRRSPCDGDLHQHRHGGSRPPPAPPPQRAQRSTAAPSSTDSRGSHVDDRYGYSGRVSFAAFNVAGTAMDAVHNYTCSEAAACLVPFFHNSWIRLAWRPFNATISAAWPADIPRAIHLSARNATEMLTSPTRMAQYWRGLNPGFDVHVHDEPECRAYVHERLGPDVGKMYDALPLPWAGPIRSDLWRLLYLYDHGGIYADSDAEPLVGLQQMVHQTDRLVTSSSRNSGFLNPHFIVAAPREPVLWSAVRQMIESLNRSEIASDTPPLLTRHKRVSLYADWGCPRNLYRAYQAHFAQPPNRSLRDPFEMRPGYRLLREGVLLMSDPAFHSRKVTLDAENTILLFNKVDGTRYPSFHLSVRLRHALCPDQCLGDGARLGASA